MQALQDASATVALRALLEEARHSESGFATHARRLRDPRLRAVVTLRGWDHENNAQTLRVLLAALGAPVGAAAPDDGEPAAWRGTDASSDAAVLEACEAAEERVADRCRLALAPDLPGSARGSVRRQLDEALRSRDLLRELRLRASAGAGLRP